MPKNYVTLNHGFYFKKALEDVGYLDTVNYNFYAADGDVIMRLNECGWKSVALENCFSEHLCHKPKLRNRGVLSPSNERDMNTFRKRYPFEKTKNYFIKYTNQTISKKPFYLYAFANVFYGYLLRIVDKYRNADK